jgi:predicted transcriptional regulator
MAAPTGKGETMNTVTLEVRSPTESLADFLQAWKSGRGSEARISFATEELLWKVLSANRRAILNAMTGAGPLALREIACRVERDVKAVHADVQALLNVGLIQRSDDGFLHPYDGVHRDFLLKLT